MAFIKQFVLVKKLEDPTATNFKYDRIMYKTHFDDNFVVLSQRAITTTKSIN